MGGELEVTSAKKWREKANEPTTLTLPSGNTIKVRKPSTLGLLRKGIIPMNLFNVALGAQGGVNMAKMKPEEIKGFCEFLAVYLCNAAIEPRIVTGEPKDGEVSLDDLSDDDQFWLFNKLEQEEVRPGGDPALGSFPKKPDGPVAGSNGKEVQSAPVVAPKP